ncbi:uncharacterized protein YxjI [Lactobacillus colini]|uniref:Uncharacterized protein YxjI n=1 Tax=Lactobacillus colini TaxID=1819254 RepID=A0ABS4MDD5_9LACO|nr:hypothetical protein [Lactobacillus colini]MBP2057695.1 uncharacterized protein YxjI [Lactobacillus colini]
MRYSLSLSQNQDLGQSVIRDEHNQPCFILQGKLGNIANTIILSDINHQEIGRLYLDSANFITTYCVDVINHSIVKVKKINSPLANVFFITRLNYWIQGSIKKGHYGFFSGIKKVASVQTLVTDGDFKLTYDIAHPEDVPFILLISILFTQLHTPPLKLPQLKLPINYVPAC